jgi:hypothetical protein
MLDKKGKIYRFLIVDNLFLAVLLGINYLNNRMIWMGIAFIITFVAFVVILICYILEYGFNK